MPSATGSASTREGRAKMARGSLVAGARIRVRDAEWVVGHVEKNSISGAVIHATGLSGIVRDKPVLERNIEFRTMTCIASWPSG